MTPQIPQHNEQIANNNRLNPSAVHNIVIDDSGSTYDKRKDYEPRESERFNTQKRLAYQTKNKSLFTCRRYAHGDYGRFKTDGKKLKMGGIQRCLSPNCYWCSRKRIKELCEDLKLVLNYAVDNEMLSYFITTTHNKSLSIAQNDKITREGYKSIRITIKGIERDYNIKMILFSTIEMTYSRPEHYEYHGDEMLCTTHSHLHTLVSIPAGIDNPTRIKILKRIVKAWNRGVKSAGGRTLDKLQNVDNLSEDYRRAGLDVKLIDNSIMSSNRVASYLGKIITSGADYKLADELSRHQTKKGKGRSLLTLLDDIIRYNNDADKKAWRWTVDATYGKSRTFKNNYFKKILKDALIHQDALATKYAEEIVSKISGFTDLHEQIQRQVIDNEKRDYLMDNTKEDFKATADIKIPREIYNTIGFYDFNGVLFDLILLAGRGEMMKEFLRLKRFIDDNPNFYNGKRSTKHKPTLELLNLLKDVEAKLRFSKPLDYEIECDD